MMGEMVLPIIILVLGSILPIILNPVVYFFIFKFYKKKEWVRVNHKQPTLNDMIDEMDNEFSSIWYFPMVGLILTMLLVIYFFGKPFYLVWERKLKNLKI